jgi:hypothetical protein
VCSLLAPVQGGKWIIPLSFTLKFVWTLSCVLSLGTRYQQGTPRLFTFYSAQARQRILVIQYNIQSTAYQHKQHRDFTTNSLCPNSHGRPKESPIRRPTRHLRPIYSISRIRCLLLVSSRNADLQSFNCKCLSLSVLGVLSSMEGWMKVCNADDMSTEAGEMHGDRVGALPVENFARDG